MKQTQRERGEAMAAEDLQDAKELMDKYDKEYNGLSRKEFQRQRT